MESISHKLEQENKKTMVLVVPKKEVEKEEEKEQDVRPRFFETEVVAESPEANVTLDDILTTPESRQRVQEYVETVFEGPLARKYFHLMLSDGRDRLMDHTYGVHNVDNKWIVGNLVLEIDKHDDSLHITRNNYKRTTGLY